MLPCFFKLHVEGSEKLIELEDIKVLRKLFLYSFYGYVYGFDWDFSVFFVLPCQKDFVLTEHLNAPEQTLL